MKQNEMSPGTPLSREAMKNIKGGREPQWTIWTCTNEHGYYVGSLQLTNPDTVCAGVGTCTYKGQYTEVTECELIPV
ncbi:MAG TPA: hypothetical protein VG101_03420 [Puia sp.]|jgi:hypothetical protein|nr:hypothetical protein [Puia sp.]